MSQGGLKHALVAAAVAVLLGVVQRGGHVVVVVAVAVAGWTVALAAGAVVLCAALGA